MRCLYFEQQSHAKMPNSKQFLSFILKKEKLIEKLPQGIQS